MHNATRRMRKIGHVGELKCAGELDHGSMMGLNSFASAPVAQMDRAVASGATTKESAIITLPFHRLG